MLDAMEILICLLTFLISVFVLNRITGNKNAKRRYPPSMPALPLVGSLPFLGSLEKLPEYFMKTADRLGPVFSFYSGRKLAVVLNGKEAIVEALVTNSADFADRPPIYCERYGDNVKLSGIAFKPYNASFKKYHKIALSILREFGFGVKDVSERLIQEDVEELVDEIRRKNGKAFDIKLLLSAAVSNMTVAILYGKKFLRAGSDHKDIVEVMEMHARCIDPAFDVAPLIRFIPYYRRKLKTLAETVVILRRCVAAGIKSALTEDDDNFVKRFIQIEGPDYDRDELFYILRDVTGGSMETITSTIRWAMFYLVNNPNIQSRLHKEIDSVLSRDRPPSLDDKPHLPYTEAFILETMRIKSVFPLTIPHAVMKDKELNGYFIPKETLVLVNLHSVHMDSKVFKEPEVFRPERFLDKDDNVVGRERIIPFSLGKRACPGENLARKSLFLFLTALIQHFDIRPPEGQESIVVSDVCGIVFYPSAFDARLIPRWKI